MSRFTIEDQKKFLRRELERRAKVCLRLEDGNPDPRSGTAREMSLIGDMIDRLGKPTVQGVEWAFDVEGGIRLDLFIPGEDMKKIVLPAEDGELVKSLFEKNTASAVLQAMVLMVAELQRMVVEQRKDFIKNVDSQSLPQA